MTIPINRQIAAVRDELSMRRRLYPRWVKDGRLTQERADGRIAEMEAVRATLERVRDEQIERLTAELAEAKETLQFVERWANHHGAKPTCSAEAALSCIQHYPPIIAITRGYADGQVPDTPNPWAEVAALRKDAERYRFIRDNHEVRGSAMEIVYGMNGSDWDAAIDAALAKERP